MSRRANLIRIMETSSSNGKFPSGGSVDLHHQLNEPWAVHDSSWGHLPYFVSRGCRRSIRRS